jgi:hypothetical protein
MLHTLTAPLTRHLRHHQGPGKPKRQGKGEYRGCEQPALSDGTESEVRSPTTHPSMHNTLTRTHTHTNTHPPAHPLTHPPTNVNTQPPIVCAPPPPSTELNLCCAALVDVLR